MRWLIEFRPLTFRFRYSWTNKIWTKLSLRSKRGRELNLRRCMRKMVISTDLNKNKDWMRVCRPSNHLDTKIYTVWHRSTKVAFLNCTLPKQKIPCQDTLCLKKRNKRSKGKEIVFSDPKILRKSLYSQNWLNQLTFWQSQQLIRVKKIKTRNVRLTFTKIVMWTISFSELRNGSSKSV